MTPTLPNRIAFSYRDPFLTFIVPAPNGCSLCCPFCYIDRCHEAACALDLDPEELPVFILDLANRRKVKEIYIQGCEPLLPESFAYTKAILNTGQRLDISVSLVTGFTHLAEQAEELSELAPDKTTVSIDSADPAIHDKRRGKIGAFEETILGIHVDAAGQLPDASNHSINEADVLRAEKRLKVLTSAVLGLIAEGWLIEDIMQGSLPRDVWKILASVEMERREHNSETRLKLFLTIGGLLVPIIVAVLAWF